MRKTIIENWWHNMETGKICKVFFHYERQGAKPYVIFVGYNPFPFFCGKEKLYTSKTVFNTWMVEHGWKPIIKQSEEISRTVIIKQD